MSLIEETADKLAQRTVDIIGKTGDEAIERRVADEIGSASPTLQEAFLTAMRMRKAEQRGMALLEKYERGDAIPKAAISSQPQDDAGH